MKTWWLASVGN